MTIEIIKFDNSITSIGQRCFEQFIKVKTIEFSRSITTIQSYVFYQSNIQNLSIPNIITLIRSNAFAENNNLESIEFMEGEKELVIEQFAFKNCEKLQTFSIPKRLQEFTPRIIDSCNNIKEIKINENNQKIC